MYIIKNALRCIGRSKGRNVLIGIIALVIAVSACIGLSIRQAAESARASALEGMSVTATIQYDRAGAMQNISGPPGKPGEDFDMDDFRDQFAGMMGNDNSLTLAEYEKYAKAASVKSFYYTLTVYFNATDALLPISNDNSSSSSSSSSSGGSSFFPGNFGDMDFNMGETGDFSVVGYSDDSAMADFLNTSSLLDDGVMFEEGTTELVCLISEELSIYNNVSVGDVITLTNPSLSSESYELTVVGIYTSTVSNDFSVLGFGQDPANSIYMSAAALQSIVDASEASSTTVEDSEGNETETKLAGSISATYAFADVEAYETFKDEEVRALGLDTAYTVESSDLNAFENQLYPLNTLSTMAGWFLVVILIIGGVILVVLNIFNVRERKYEVGVLTAMGMKKWKVAAQFMCEILVVTMAAVILGAGIGAVSSVPVTNALLENQISSQSNRQDQMNQNFGRPVNMGGFSGMPSDMPGNMGGGKNPFESMIGNAEDYIAEVDSAMNLTVVFQMMGVGLLLTLIASAASVMFIMRYDPLKILANRD